MYWHAIFVSLPLTPKHALYLKVKYTVFCLLKNPISLKYTNAHVRVVFLFFFDKVEKF